MPNRKESDLVYGYICMPVVGNPFPANTLVDHRGDEWTIEQHRGRPVLLIFHRHLG